VNWRSWKRWTAGSRSANRATSMCRSRRSIFSITPAGRTNWRMRFRWATEWVAPLSEWGREGPIERAGTRIAKMGSPFGERGYPNLWACAGRSSRGISPC